MGAKLNQEQLYAQAMDLIKEKRLYFWRHVAAHLGIATSTFYTYFPSGSSDYKEMQQLLEKNRAETLTKQLIKWEDSSQPQLQLALAKLIGDDEVRRRLSYNYQDGPPQIPQQTVNVINVKELPTEVLLGLKQAYVQQRESQGPQEHTIDIEHTS